MANKRFLPRQHNLLHEHGGEIREPPETASPTVHLEPDLCASALSTSIQKWFADEHAFKLKQGSPSSFVPDPPPPPPSFPRVSPHSKDIYKHVTCTEKSSPTRGKKSKEKAILYYPVTGLVSATVRSLSILSTWSWMGSCSTTLPSSSRGSCTWTTTFTTPAIVRGNTRTQQGVT